MTNGTTGEYNVLWRANLKNRCLKNNTDARQDSGGEGWHSGPNDYAYEAITFSTAPDGKLPDIEATVNACAEPDEDTSAAVRVTDVRETVGGESCPVLDTGIRAASCGYKSIAKEIAANVSSQILDKMHSRNGTWQAIKAPCARIDSLAATLGVDLIALYGLAVGATILYSL